jgi:hypothetical protein
MRQNLTKCVHVEQKQMAAAGAGALCTLNLFLLRKGRRREGKPQQHGSAREKLPLPARREGIYP